MSTEQIRKAFEAWCASDNPRYHATDDSTSNRRDWHVWQAALSQPAAPAPKDSEQAMHEISLFGQLQEALEKIAILEQERDNLRDDLVCVERWANHHGQKAHMTPQETLSCIQHYPSILAITRSYTDGKVPETRNPYAEIAELQAQLAAQPVVAPLTDAQAERLFRNTPVAQLEGIAYKAAFVRLLRYFEAVHGINAAAQGGKGESS